MIHSPKSIQKGTPSRSENDLLALQNEKVDLLTESPDCFVTQRTRRPPRVYHSPTLSDLSDLSEIKDMMQSMMSRQDLLEKHILDIKGQTSSIESTNLDIERSMTRLSDQMTIIEVQITNLERERKSMSTELCVIKEKLDSYDRYISKTSIEISNVPKRPNETKEMLYETVSHLTSHLKLVLSPNDYRDVTRLPSKKEQKVSGIIVEFANTLLKTRYLDAARDYNKKNKNNKLNNTHLGFSEPTSPVYIAELLTPASRKLFYLTRKFIKESHYSFCWTSNGKVFVKETKDSAYFQIKDENQIKALTKTNPE